MRKDLIKSVRFGLILHNLSGTEMCIVLLLFSSFKMMNEFVVFLLFFYTFLNTSIIKCLLEFLRDKSHHSVDKK